MPELERRVKFEEAISAKRRGWHSPFRTICAAGFWKPMRQEREAFAPWRHSSASVGGTARRSVCSRCAAARSVVRRSGGMVLSRSEEHTSELQSLRHLVCRLLLEKKNRRADH